MAAFQFDRNGPEMMNIHEESPAGVRVLVVDNCPTFQSEIENRLQSCYLCTVMKCSSAKAALDQLTQHGNAFDIVLVDAEVPDMDEFPLHSHIVNQMGLPIIMMSANDEKDSITRGAISGACDYLIKPISDEALNNIYQHGLRKRRGKWDGQSDDAKVVHGVLSSRKRKDGEKLVVNRDDNNTSQVLKKQRMVWSPELHQKFIEAVNQLGVDRAVPKKILELMNVSWITRENVASHLQKYRLNLKREADQTQSSIMPSSSSDMVMPMNDQRSHLIGFGVPHQRQHVQNFKQLNLRHTGSLKETLQMQSDQKHSNEAYLSENQFSMLPFEQSMLFGGNGIIPFIPKFELPSNIVPRNYSSSSAFFEEQNEHVQNPNVAEHVQSLNGAQLAQNQNIARHVQNQNIARHVQNQNVARHVQNENVAQHVQSQNVARHEQNQNVAQHVQNQNVVQHVQSQNPFDYSVHLKLEINQMPNSESTLLQQPFDYPEFTPHPMQQGSFWNT